MCDIELIHVFWCVTRDCELNHWQPIEGHYSAEHWVQQSSTFLFFWKHSAFLVQLSLFLRPFLPTSPYFFLPLLFKTRHRKTYSWPGNSPALRDKRRTSNRERGWLGGGRWSLNVQPYTVPDYSSHGTGQSKCCLIMHFIQGWQKLYFIFYFDFNYWLHTSLQRNHKVPSSLWRLTFTLKSMNGKKRLEIYTKCYN